MTRGATRTDSSLGGACRASSRRRRLSAFRPMGGASAKPASQPFDVIDPIGTQRRSALSRRIGDVTGRIPGFPALRPQGAQRFTQQLPLVLAQALNVFQPSLDLVERIRV